MFIKGRKGVGLDREMAIITSTIATVHSDEELADEIRRQGKVNIMYTFGPKAGTEDTLTADEFNSRFIGD